MKRISLIFSLCLIIAHGFVFSQAVVRTFTSSGNFVVPSGVTEIVVECWGGGGAGGGVTTNNHAGGGGGGGAYAKKVISVAPGDIIPFIVGTGGTVGTGAGGNGSTSSFNTNIVVAVGGFGGGANNGGVGGLGGDSTNCIGDIVFSGGNGAASVSGASGGGGGAAAALGFGYAASGMTGGLSGGIGGGNGANGRDNEGNGSTGFTYGGGGSGGRKGGFISSNRNGGAGATGAVVITYTVPNCTGNPSPAGNVTISSSTGCAGATITLNATNLSTDFGVEYRWMKSEDNGASWTNIGDFAVVPSSGNASLNQTLNISTLFKIETRCTLDANLTSESNEVSFTVNCWSQPINTVVTSCSGYFYDSGGPTGNYLINQNYTYTFYPANPGEKVKLTFTQFAVELGYDGMMVYDGNSTTAPLISSGSIYNRATCPNGAWTGTTGAFVPTSFLSTATDGSLTVTFRSDADEVLAGWTAEISCVDVPPAPAMPTANSPACDSVIIVATGSAPSGETWYWQTSPTGTNTDLTGDSLTVYMSGTYYIRSLKTSNSVWSLPTAITAQILNAPSCPSGPIPAHGSNNVCYDGHGKVTTISWLAVAGAISYDVYFGADSLPSIVAQNVSTNLFVLPSDLLPNTNYFWKVVAKNQCGELSNCQEWTFTTRNELCYCSSTSTNTNSYFNAFSTSLGYANINNSVSGFSPTGYGDFSAMQVSQIQGGRINFTTSLIGTTVGVNMWVDWNNNGIFDEPSERVYSSGTFVSSCSGTISVPNNASPGAKRLRIKMDFNSTNPSSCGNITRGETEDYTFVVIERPETPNTPIANTPSCDSVVISKNGVAPSGIEWYWQTTANGTSIDNSAQDWVVYNSGKYFLRSRRIADEVWGFSDSIQVVVNRIPGFANNPSPTNDNQNVCYLGHNAVTQLSWSVVPNASAYLVFFGVDSLFNMAADTVYSNVYPFTNNLIPDTKYFWKILPISVCGNSNIDSVAVWSFKTVASQCYCTPAPSSVDEQGISNVTMGAINNTTINEPGNYGNYTYLSTFNQAGETQNFSITLRTGFTYNVKMWIDWNNNGSFLDAGDEVYAATSTSNNPTTLSGSFVIPTGIAEGNYRIRIGAVWTTSGQATPCYTGTYAAYEDYTLVICNYPLTPETPISNSPACGSVVISQVGIVPDGDAWYWQTEATGVSVNHNLADYTVNQSGTYFIRAKRECGLWGNADSISVVVYQHSQNPSSIDGNDMAINGESVDLEVVGGSLGTDAVWRWYHDDCGNSTPFDEGAAISVIPQNQANTYFVRAEGLCDTTDCVSIVIETFEPTGGDCDVIYVSLSGNNAYLGTSDMPVRSLYRAMQLVNNNRRYIKIEEGLYNETHRINMLSDVTIDGGYRIENGVWVKSSSAVSHIHFIQTTTGANPTVSSVNDDLRHLIGVSSNNANAWILQDLKITTADVTGHSANGKGSSNYAVWINESIYSINRCEIFSGNASSGIDGDTPTSYGANGGNGGLGAPAGNNVGGSGSVGGVYTDGASAGIGGLGGAGCSGGCRAATGAVGQPGANGLSFAAGDVITASVEDAAYFMPVGREDGQPGGGGGGAGGGGGSATYDIICGAKKGGNGGNGGRGGLGGNGGQGGGGSFGIWIFNSTAMLNMADIVVSAGIAGDGGLGADGGLGENGQTGQAGENNEGLCSASNGGGTGGTGGKGGNGGRGRDGAFGVAQAIVINGQTDVSTGIIAQSPEIKVYHDSPKLCRNSEIKLVKESGSDDWNFGIDLQLLNDLDVINSSYAHDMDVILVYSNLQNVNYSLVSPIQYANFIRMNIDERALPQINVPSDVICHGQQSIELSATNWGDQVAFDWVIFETTADNILLTSDQQEAVFDISNLNAGTYKIRYRVKESCCGWSIPVYAQFVINPKPEGILVSGGTEVCGTNTNLVASGGNGGVIYWQGTTSGGTSIVDNSINQTITEAGTYYFRAQSSLGCWGDEVAVDVQFFDVPEAVVVSGSTTQCGGTVELIATGGTGGTIYWQANDALGVNLNHAVSQFEVDTTGTYYFRSLSNDGCWGQAGSAVVVINSVPEPVVVSGGGSYCAAPVVLSAQGGQGGLIYWQNTDAQGENIDNQIDVFSVVTDGTYYFRAKSAEGCWGVPGSATVEIQAAPSNLNATSITHFSASLSWTENGNATTWDIEWGTAGFTLGNGTLISNVTQNPYLLTGLTESTAYDFYVRSVCSSSDVGDWSNKHNFSTIVNSIDENLNEAIKIWLWNDFVNAFVPENEQVQEFALYDIQGRLIKITNQKQIPVDGLPNGVYVVRITTDKQIKTDKIQIIK